MLFKSLHPWPVEVHDVVLGGKTGKCVVKPGEVFECNTDLSKKRGFKKVAEAVESDVEPDIEHSTKLEEVLVALTEDAAGRTFTELREAISTDTAGEVTGRSREGLLLAYAEWLLEQEKG